MAPDGLKVGDEGSGLGKFSTEDASRDISHGPIAKRGCTDVLCLALFAAAWVLFLIVSYAGAADGEPERLYKPRDYRGDYCGLEKQWESSTNLQDYAFLSFTMNVSGTVDDLAQQLVCSTVAENALEGLLSAAQLEQYRCACCKTPCGACIGVLGYADFTSPAALATSFASRMADLTNPTRALQLFATSGANGGAFNGLWTQIDKYFVESCVKSCTSTAYNGTDMRRYTYSPPPDVAWKTAWDQLRGDTRAAYASIQKTLATDFTFAALPASECPYDDPRHCVPFPGISFVEGYAGWCNFQVASDVAAAMGDAVNQMGLSELSDKSAASFGTAMGDALESLDSLALVGLCALCYGFLFMVLLRFFIKPAVWGSLLLVFVLLLVGGYAAYIQSAKCRGDGLVQSGTTYAQAANKYAWSLTEMAPAGANATLEELTGNGQDYRGTQTLTRSLRTCQRWDSQEPHSHSYDAARYAAADLRENFCRNPGGSAVSIWCYTTDPTTRWELCSPLGVTPLDRECPNGYAVRDKRMRVALQVFAGIVFGLALLWLLVCCCLLSRIRLAIAITQVAATFVFNTPLILVVPIVQTVTALLWVMFWFFCAGFLLSQVPDGYVPTGAYTWAEAHGNATAPGECTGTWPAGFAWRYPGNVSAVDDPCSGRLGDSSGIEPRCWKCGPPRYAFDVRFACSFFMFLWNNELLIALGQCIVAGACAAWFFQPASERAVFSTGRAHVKRAVYNVFRYHLGSLAFGAFIIAAVQFIRYCLLYLEKQSQQQHNRVMTWILRILQCCVWCLETFLRFINKNAYIQIAILGKNFCTSAKEAFGLIMRNALRIATLGALGGIVRFIGMSFIVVATTITGFGILTAMDPQVPPVVPMLMFLVFSYMVGQSFLNVFGLAVDSMLQCFVAAEEMKLPADVVPAKLRELRSTVGDGDCCSACLCCFGGGGVPEDGAARGQALRAAAPSAM